MKIRTWHPDMTDKETAELAYWERNALALHFAEGWYNDDVETHEFENGMVASDSWGPRFRGWRRVLTLAGGSITFHIPDDFDVGTLPQVEPNWDGHTTEGKWRSILISMGVKPETPP